MSFLEHQPKGLARFFVDADLPSERLRIHISEVGPGARSQERVLVVDDNVDAAELLAAALQRRGYETMVAHDAEQALALSLEWRPALALLDIGLPGVDGYQLAALMRAQLAGVALVALTGYGQPADRARSREAGFSEHLVKPATVEQVQAVIQRLLGERG